MFQAVSSKVTPRVTPESTGSRPTIPNGKAGLLLDPAGLSEPPNGDEERVSQLERGFEPCNEMK